MATRIAMKHRESGLMKDGFYGFSWTTFFFGAFPALFRGDFLTFIGVFVVIAIIAVVTIGIGAWPAMIVWAFMYNKYYTRKLIEKGYAFAGSDGDNAMAAAALGISSPAGKAAAVPIGDEVGQAR